MTSTTERMPAALIHALALIKREAARVPPVLSAHQLAVLRQNTRGYLDRENQKRSSLPMRNSCRKYPPLHA